MASDWEQYLLSFCQQISATLLNGMSLTINDSAPAGDRDNFVICEI
jgi:hypothetical protein